MAEVEKTSNPIDVIDTNLEEHRRREAISEAILCAVDAPLYKIHKVFLDVLSKRGYAVVYQPKSCEQNAEGTADEQGGRGRI